MRTKTGLSLKQLGKSEYWHRYYLLKFGSSKDPRGWTGLSEKALGHTEYVSQWRKLRANRK